MIKISETWVNRTEGYTIGDSGIYETYTNDIDELFKSLEDEYGKFISKMYLESGGKSVEVGWVFSKTDYYEDTQEPYTKETWVEIKDPEKYDI